MPGAGQGGGPRPAALPRRSDGGASALLILGQPGRHAPAALAVAANITLLPLPPGCPGLNPVGNVWQFLRDKWLSNTIFTSCDDTVENCRRAWNNLIWHPQRITSVGLRKGRIGEDQRGLVLPARSGSGNSLFNIKQELSGA